MKRIAYTVAYEGDLVIDLLKENGCEVLIGNGAFDDGMLAICEALIPGMLHVTREILEKAPNLKVVTKFGVGMDRIDVDACTKRGVYACCTPMSNFVAVSEHTIALMMAAAKQIYMLAVLGTRPLSADEMEAFMETSMKLIGFME